MPTSRRPAARSSRTARILTQLVTVTALAGAGVFGGVGSAHAAPGNCTESFTGRDHDQTYSYCRTGTGTYRAVAGCRASNGFVFYRYGAVWLRPGGPYGSLASCGTGVAFYKGTQKTN